MRSRVRALCARAAAPILAALDRRLDALATRIEAHTGNLAARSDARFDAVDERLDIDLRVVDEHLLAVERATRDLRAGSPLPAGAVAAGNEPALLLVVPEGKEEAVPGGYAVVDRTRHGDHTILRLAPKP